VRDRFAHWHLHSHVRDNNLVQGNLLQNCNDESIYVVGKNSVVLDNRILGCDDGMEIGKFEKYDATSNLTRSLLDGDNPTLIGNTVIGCADDCMDIDCGGGCTAGLVADNYINGATDEDDVRSGVVWRLERLTDCPSSQGILIRNAVNFIIKNNTVASANDNGIDYAGRNGQILENKIRYTGSESLGSYYGIRVDGRDNMIDGNIMQFVSTGIGHRSGNRNVYRNNVVDRATAAGIHVDGGTDILIEENTISNCQGDAIAITGGSDIVVRANVLADNKNDLCNEEGTDADVTLQSALTTTISCIHY
jgi:parallel beta-helix repeat protein